MFISTLLSRFAFKGCFQCLFQFFFHGLLPRFAFSVHFNFASTVCFQGLLSVSVSTLLSGLLFEIIPTSGNRHANMFTPNPGVLFPREEASGVQISRHVNSIAVSESTMERALDCYSLLLTNLLPASQLIQGDL